MRQRRTIGPDMAVIAEAVRELRDRFDYPDIEGGASAGVPAVAGGAGGTPTVVVAASNASDISKSKADYICAGSNDQVTLQAAINSLPSIGRVLLTEGDFNIDPTDSVNVNNGISLQGLSSAGTVIKATAPSSLGAGTPAPIVSMACGGRLSNLAINANGQTDVAGIRQDGAVSFGVSAIEDVWVKAKDHYGILVQCGPARIRHCYIETQTTGIGIEVEVDQVDVIDCEIQSVDDGIEMNSSFSSKVLGCYIGSGATGVSSLFAEDLTIADTTIFAVTGISDLSENTTITGCYLSASQTALVVGGSGNHRIVGNHIIASQTGIDATAAPEFLGIVGNHLVTFGAAGSGFYAIDTDGADQCVIADNTFADCLGGIRIQNSAESSDAFCVITNNALDINSARCIEGEGRGFIIEGNLIHPGLHGIDMAIHDSLIEGNLFWLQELDANNTYDGIILTGDSDRNYILGNRFIGRSSGNKPRYAINISAATCNDNAYLANKAGPSGDYGTAAYNNAGTGTVITWPAAGAPQGDNLL